MCAKRGSGAYLEIGSLDGAATRLADNDAVHTAVRVSPEISAQDRLIAPLLCARDLRIRARLAQVRSEQLPLARICAPSRPVRAFNAELVDHLRDGSACLRSLRGRGVRF